MTMRRLRFRVLVIGYWLSVIGCWPLAPALAGPQQIIEIQPQSQLGRVLLRQLADWRLQGPIQAMSAAEYSSHDADRAALMSEYGLREMAVGNYVNQHDATVRVEVFRMINYVAAYGAYSLERDADATRIDVGTEGALSKNVLGFFKGAYYVRLSTTGGARPDARQPEALIGLAQRLADQLRAGTSEIPVLIQHLPEEHLVPGTERFIAGPLALAQHPGYDNPNDVFFLASEAVEAAIAEYESNGRRSQLMMVEYHTPQLAGEAYRRVQQYFDALPDAERQRRLLKREGNYIIEAFNIQDPGAMQHIVGQIKYGPSIHWLGEDPFEFLRDMQAGPELNMVDWMLTVFGGIGVMLLMATIMGTMLGVSFFLWRRWRQRQFPGFSDAGGMLRLNLDNLALPPPPRRKSLPGK